MSSNIHFVLNSHGLGFDRYSLLCIKSIRHICGPDVRVSVYCPKNLPPPSDKVLRFYDRNRIEVIYFYNEFLPDYLDDLRKVPSRYLAFNKLYTLQEIQEKECRVFLDADIIFLKDPCSFFIDIRVPNGVSPVNTPEAFGGDWRQLYDEVKIKFPQETLEVWETYTCGNEPEPRKLLMPPYFSSGIICATNESLLPKYWFQMCQELEQKIHLIPKTFFLDQVALSVAIQKTEQPYYIIPRNFNTTYEIWRFTPNVHLFHYVTLDALAAAIARFPEVRNVMQGVVTALAKEDGIDFRFELLTQWPRWYRRGMGILSRYSEKLFGIPLVERRERY